MREIDHLLKQISDIQSNPYHDREGWSNLTDKLVNRYLSILRGLREYAYKGNNLKIREAVLSKVHHYEDVLEGVLQREIKIY